MVFEFSFLAFVVVDAVEEVGVEVWPFLEGVFFAEEAWGHVLRNEGCFDEQSARTTHWINEIRIAIPAREEYHASGKHLVERGLYTLLTVTTTVE